MNILVTGGAGYIGSHTCLSLLDAGYKVTIIDNLSTGYEKLIPAKAKFIKANINETDILNNLLKQKSFNALIHFAGFIQVEESIKFPEKYFKNNTINSSILFEICLSNGLNNIIFSSTAAAYGNTNKNKTNENDDLNPLNPYADSKVQTEKQLLKLSKSKKIHYIILRYFNVAGADPRLRSGLISKNPTHLIKIASEAAIGKRNSVTIFGNDYNTHDGTAIRDYIHVSDLANIHVKSLEYLLEKKSSTIMNCGYGKGYSVKEVLDKMNTICDKKINIEYGKRRSGDAVSLVSDISKLSKTIEWTPEYDDLEKILKTSINWEKKLQNE
jgi:UDP-glucose 4-epimerase